MVDNRISITVKVIPNSNRNEILESENGYIAYVKEKAENNKANISLIKILSKKFNVNYKNIKIINPSSRKKIVQISHNL